MVNELSFFLLISARTEKDCEPWSKANLKCVTIATTPATTTLGTDELEHQ